LVELTVYKNNLIKKVTIELFIYFKF